MGGVYFLYDGSIHSDWVSHYAVRLAARHDEKKLHLLHILESPVNSLPPGKIESIRRECRRLEVELQTDFAPLSGSVFQTICASVPAGSGNYLICGTRSRERKRGLLSGTVSEQLLRSGHCHVLALRIGQPGLLGLPKQLLLPVSGHPRGFRSGLPFLKLFSQDVLHLHILYVAKVSPWRFRTLSHQAAEHQRQPGLAYCKRIEEEIRTELTLTAGVVDFEVVVSDDVPKEIVITANKTKSRLIYLGASERNLTERFFFGNPVEQILRDATCDVAIYRGIA